MIGKTVEANLPKEFLESNRSDIINSNKSEKNRGYIEKSPYTCNEELHYIEISNHEMLPEITEEYDKGNLSLIHRGIYTSS